MVEGWGRDEDSWNAFLAIHIITKTGGFKPQKVIFIVCIIGPRSGPVGKPFLPGFRGRIPACSSQLVLAVRVPSLSSRVFFCLCYPLLSPKDFMGFSSYWVHPR